MKLDKGDEIATVKLVRDDQDVLISTFNGLCLRTNINKIRLFKGRSSKGLKGIKLSNNDEVISLSVINKVESSENEKKIILKIEDSKIKKNTKLMELKIKNNIYCLLQKMVMVKEHRRLNTIINQEVAKEERV